MTEKSGQELEDGYCEILAAIKAQVSIPVALKVAPYFTAFGHFATRLAEMGVDGLVLFNRFAQFDLDLRQLKTMVRGAFVDPVGFNTSLRWMALLSGKLRVDLVASGGIKKPEDVVKQLLAGAKAVQVVSILYHDGLDRIKQLLTGLKDWMAEKQFASLADFRGKLNQINNPQSLAYIRAQYLKTITGVE
jgi:dihydroorotate dehydrogenase (fumarate)